MELFYKGYKIVPEGAFGMKRIKADGKGSVHLSLRGTYSSGTMAKRAIDLYLSRPKTKKKVTTNGETE